MSSHYGISREEVERIVDGKIDKLKFQQQIETLIQRLNDKPTATRSDVKSWCNDWCSQNLSAMVTNQLIQNLHVSPHLSELFARHSLHVQDMMTSHQQDLVRLRETERSTFQTQLRDLATTQLSSLLRSDSSSPFFKQVTSQVEDNLEHRIYSACIMSALLSSFLTFMISASRK